VTAASQRLIEPYAAGFWEAAEKQQLVMQRCQTCAAVQLYPRRRCVSCGADRLEYVPVTGRGTVYTFSTIYRNPPSEFIEDLPYTLAIVELDEGPRLLTRVVDCDPEGIRCDMPVQCVFTRHDGRPLPVFRPIEEAT
jgi:uncharacterized OB-fold protein